MSSLTNSWPNYAVYILLGLLVLVLGFIFFKTFIEGFKALGRTIKEGARFLSWATMGFAIVILMGGAAFFILTKDPFHFRGEKKSKLKVAKPSTTAAATAPARSAPDKGTPPALAAAYRPPVCREIRGVQDRIFDYYCPHGTVRVWVPLKRIDPVFAEYVVMLEDDKFYQHGGLDADGIFNALEKDIKAGKFVRGGSTITQQLAKNLFLTKEKSIMRKLEEVPIALRLENELSKSQILELYLNTIEWGPGVHGIEAGCRLYFDHDASQLSEPERWLMALMIPNPKELNLWVQPRGRKSLLNRARRFSQRLKYEKHISESERQTQFQTFVDFLDQWALKKPTSTWMEARRYPASWAKSLSLVTIPALWHRMTASKKNQNSVLALDWGTQARLSALLVAKSKPTLHFAHSGNAIIFTHNTGPGTAKTIGAVGPWPSGKPSGEEFATLARETGYEMEVLPVNQLSQDWFFAP